MDGRIYQLYGLNWLPNSMPLNLFWTIRILGSYSCGWSIIVLATFCNSTCLTILVLMWKGTKMTITCHFPSQNAQTFESNLTIFESTYSWSRVSAMYLVWSNFRFFGVNMTMVLHPTHSLVPLHTWMIVSNFFKSPQPHQYWHFLPPPNLPLVHSNLEMQTNTQTWVVYLL